MIDIKKKYRTRDGREARIYADDGSESFPTHGAINNSEGWSSMNWTSRGSVHNKGYSPTDLVEVVMLPEYWVVFLEGVSLYALANEPSLKEGRTVIHHPAQEKPIT
jgi:hypothetical protein